MCAILDANVAHEVFGPSRPAAGAGFFRWVDSGSGRLVTGGKALRELTDHAPFRQWRLFAEQFGRLRVVTEALVRGQTRAALPYRLSGNKVRRRPARTPALHGAGGRYVGARLPGAPASSPASAAGGRGPCASRPPVGRDGGGVGRRLHFEDRALVANPAGKVYSTIRSQAFGRAKRDLLRQTRCAAPHPEGGDR